MKCIQSHCPFLPLHSRIKHKQPLKADALLLPFREGTTRAGFERSQKLPMRTRVITSSFILGATSAVKAGDISVLLQTGGLLLLMYGITNFVVPSFISKNLRPEKANMEPVIEDDSDDDESEETQSPRD
uniref:Uncharacterized protein MANES_15G070100 n=1 Tax=Rhizophora mucronata TaxID=61149 RepID=A0A2P2LEU4_RHIMU